MANLARHLRGVARAATQRRVAPHAGALPRLRFAYPQTGAAMRYRVEHAIEEACIAGMHAEAVSISDPRSYDLSRTDLLVLYRMPLAPRTLALLLAARRWRIPVVFDCDDLVWDARLRQFEAYDRFYNRDTIRQLMQTSRKTVALMRRVDALTLSTDYLAAQAALVTRRPVFTHWNAVSREMTELSTAAYTHRHSHAGVVIGYFSGHARAHDDDIKRIAPALEKVLRDLNYTRLRLVGEVALPAVLEPLADEGRVERRALVDWRRLPSEIADVDISIAPLIDNPQRRSKSAVKYLEAGLVGVPTVAARLEPYSAIIREGEHALLADSYAEWSAALTMLAENRLLRDQLGQRARAPVLAEHTTDARAPGYARLVQQIIAACGRR